jgi:hypothetical protein
MMTFLSMMKKCSSLNFSQKHHKLINYKIMTFFVTIKHNVIIIAELDLVTKLLIDIHMSLLDPHAKFDIKIKIKVKKIR